MLHLIAYLPRVYVLLDQSRLRVPREYRAERSLDVHVLDEEERGLVRAQDVGCALSRARRRGGILRLSLAAAVAAGRRQHQDGYHCEAGQGQTLAHHSAPKKHNKRAVTRPRAHCTTARVRRLTFAPLDTLT